MGNMKIVTGRTGQKHVRAMDDARVYRTLVGNTDFILNEGNKFNAAMTTDQYGAPAILIQDGYLFMQGRMCGFDVFDGQELLSIDISNMTGMHRIDYVVAHYYATTDPESEEYSIEHCDLEIVQGERTSGNKPVPPTLVKGDMDGYEDYMVLLWQINIDEQTITSITDRRTIISTSGFQMFMDSFDAFISKWDYSSSRLAYSDTVYLSGTNVDTILFNPIRGFNDNYEFVTNDIKQLYIDGKKVPDINVGFSSASGDTWISADNTPYKFETRTPFFINYHDKLYLLGGYSTSATYRYAYSYSMDDGEWEQESNIPFAVSSERGLGTENGVAVANDALFIIDFKSSRSYGYCKICYFDDISRSWTSIQITPSSDFAEAAYNAKLVGMGTKIYIFKTNRTYSGSDLVYTNVGFELDVSNYQQITESEITLPSSMNYSTLGRFDSFHIIEYDNDIHFFNGTAHYIYDVTQNTFTLVDGNLPYSVTPSSTDACVYNGFIYFMPYGSNGNYNYYKFDGTDLTISEEVVPYTQSNSKPVIASCNDGINVCFGTGERLHSILTHISNGIQANLAQPIQDADGKTAELTIF